MWTYVLISNVQAERSVERAAVLVTPVMKQDVNDVNVVFRTSVCPTHAASLNAKRINSVGSLSTMLERLGLNVGDRALTSLADAANVVQMEPVLSMTVLRSFA